MHTTKEWWEKVSSDENKMIDWLYDQYRGEVKAAKRIAELPKIYGLSGRTEAIINIIALQEDNHASWIKKLLEDRGLIPEVKDVEERYWKEVLLKDMTFSYVCAIGHHAEVMRLERIELLSKDKRFEDIAIVFKKIYNDEIFHAKAFASMSTPEDIEKAKIFHMKGMEAIGLTI